ncbi:MAG: aminotransferase class I/II-fold pyridoxal phosphate-dependent enzyme [Acidobacteriota bacterium]
MPSFFQASRRHFLQASAAGFLGLSSQTSRSLLAARVPTSESLISLNANENPYGPSEKALAAMRAAFSIAGRYAENDVDLHGKLCRHHNVSPDMVVLGFGSSEILKLCVEAFLDSGKNVIVAHPSYEAVPRYSQLYDIKTIRVPLDSAFKHDLKRMRAAVNADTGLVYLCNPNNPTATIVSHAQVQEFVDSMPDEVPVLIDEAYHHYVQDPSYATAIPLAQRGKPVIVTRTFSKIYGMAGLRIGYAVGRSDLVRRMATYTIWLNSNVLSVAAALASLEDQAYVDRNRQINSRVRARVQEQAKSLGLPCIPSETNFLMIDLKRPTSPVLSALRSKGILAGRIFPPLTNHMRVTIGTEAEMDRFAVALKECLV